MPISNAMYTAPQSEAEVKEVIKRYTLPANTGIGQHFLIDQTVITASVITANLTKEDTVLEIGPGFGVLTQKLCEQAGRVVAIELDTRFEPILRLLQKQYPNLEVVYGDALQVNRAELGLVSGKYSVVTNLPYQITSQFFKSCLTQQPYPKQIVALIQREVAERITEKPGNMSILALSVQLFAQAEIITNVPPAAFVPPPRVDSSVIHIHGIRTTELVDEAGERLFFSLVKSGFAQKRKTLANNLKAWSFQGITLPTDTLKSFLESQNYSISARAQELSLQDWLKLVDKLK